jgi:hypothetical protein
MRLSGCYPMAGTEALNAELDRADAFRGESKAETAARSWDWELNRRAGLEYKLLPPEAAIPSEEDAVSIAAAMALRATFAQDYRAKDSAARRW